MFNLICGRGSSFKSTPGVNKVDKIDIKNKKVVKSYCNQTLDYLSNYKGYEECVIITKNGDVYYLKGDKANVPVPERLNQIGRYDLHNHPHNNGGFSNLDISSWRVGHEYFLTDGRYHYHANVKKQIPYNKDLYGESLQFAIENGIKNDDEGHVKCLYLQQKGYIDYERVERYS